MPANKKPLENRRSQRGQQPFNPCNGSIEFTLSHPWQVPDNYVKLIRQVISVWAEMFVGNGLQMVVIDNSSYFLLYTQGGTAGTDQTFNKIISN